MEFELLVQLAGEPARVFARKSCCERSGVIARSGCTRTLDSHASRLRRKLDMDGPRRWVVNVWGVGYKLL